MKTVRKLLLLFALCVATNGLWLGQAKAVASQEYEMKAAFLFYFAKFVEWPTSAFPASNASLVVGVLGEDPFGRAFEALDGKTIKNRIVKVRRLARADSFDGCHILFISSSERDRQGEIVNAVKSAPILTVGDALEQFAQYGVVVNFILVDDKIHLEINTDAARQAGLTISSQVLQLAKIVSGGH